MQQFMGWLLIIFPGILYAGQVISSFNFPLAQKWGLQENPDDTDPILQRAERYTSYWDLLTLGWMPLSGVLMVFNNFFWPLMALFSAGIYLDTAGREAVKLLSFKHEGIKIGPPQQHKIFFSTYFIMAAFALVTLTYALLEIFKGTVYKLQAVG
jgi:hypothetical protein